MLELARIRLPKQPMTIQYDIVLYHLGDREYVCWREQTETKARSDGLYENDFSEAMKAFGERVILDSTYYER